MIIKTSKLAAAVAACNSIALTRGTLPALGQLLLRLNGGHLEVTANNMEMALTITAVVEEIDTGMDYAFGVESARLSDILKTLPGESDVKLKLDAMSLHVRCDRSRFKLPILPGSDIPQWESPPAESSISVADLSRTLGRSAYAAAQQDVRHYLQGTLLAVGPDGVQIVSTDGHRLAAVRGVLHSPDDPAPWEGIIPSKGAAALIRHTDGEDVRIDCAKGQISAHWSAGFLGYTLHCRLIDGRFPDWRRVIPSEDRVPCAITANRAELIGAILRAASVGNDKSIVMIKADPAGQVIIEQRNSEGSEASAVIDAQVSQPFESGFNPRYLMDALKSITTESVILRGADSNTAIKIQPEGIPDGDQIHIVMPSRI